MSARGRAKRRQVEPERAVPETSPIFMNRRERIRDEERKALLLEHEKALSAAEKGEAIARKEYQRKLAACQAELAEARESNKELERRIRDVADRESGTQFSLNVALNRQEVLTLAVEQYKRNAKTWSSFAVAVVLLCAALLLWMVVR